MRNRPLHPLGGRLNDVCIRERPVDDDLETVAEGRCPFSTRMQKDGGPGSSCFRPVGIWIRIGPAGRGAHRCRPTTATCCDRCRDRRIRRLSDATHLPCSACDLGVTKCTSPSEHVSLAGEAPIGTTSPSYLRRTCTTCPNVCISCASIEDTDF